MKIEPCKVCGGKGHVNYGTKNRASYSVICTFCMSEPFVKWCDTPEQAIECWNQPPKYYQKTIKERGENTRVYHDTF